MASIFKTARGGPNRSWRGQPLEYGRGGAFVYAPKSGEDPWNGAWTQNLGRPLGRKHRVGTGWVRRYRRGAVLLNPSPSQSQRFVLRQRYAAADGHVVKDTESCDPHSILEMLEEVTAR